MLSKPKEVAAVILTAAEQSPEATASREANE
jgi:hypothetical protein